MATTTIGERSPDTPFRAIAARKRNAAERLEARALKFRREADELDAEADRLAAL
jgi:hypothetical protein